MCALLSGLYIGVIMKGGGGGGGRGGGGVCVCVGGGGGQGGVQGESLAKEGKKCVFKKKKRTDDRVKITCIRQNKK